MRFAAFMVIVLTAGAIVAFGETRKVDFSADAVGQPPKGFVFGHTAKVGAPGKWVIQHDGANKVLAQTDADSTRSRFPVAVLADVTAADVDLSVRFKPVSGRVDQAAGLVWRYQDEDNYYIVRANALEDNVVLYKVEKRPAHGSAGQGCGPHLWEDGQSAGRPMEHACASSRPDPFRGILQRDEAVRGRGRDVRAAGRVGVWTKADSVTQFDDLTVVTK